MRIGEQTRKTGETDIFVSIQLDGEGNADVHSGIGFFDHMLSAVAKHGLFDLTVARQGRSGSGRPPHGRGHGHRARRGHRAGVG